MENILYNIKFIYCIIVVIFVYIGVNYIKKYYNKIYNKNIEYFNINYIDDLERDPNKTLNTANINKFEEGFNKLIKKKMLAVEKEETRLKNIFSSLSVLDKLPIGTIMMWNNNTLPESDKWAWCNGSNNTPNLKFIYPLGGKSYAGNEPRPPNTNGIIKKTHTNFLFNKNKISSDYLLNHTHKIGNNFPSLKHNHTTGNQGWHDHHAINPSKYNYTKWYTYAGLKYGNFDAISPSFSGSNDLDYRGSHTHSISNSLGGSDIRNQIDNTDMTPAEWDTNSSDAPNIKYYPPHVLTNFIIKIKE